MDTTKTVSPIATAGISIVAAISGLVGGQVLDNQEIADLNTQVAAVVQEKDAAIADKEVVVQQKQDIADAYVYSQISSGRVPTINSSMSLETVQQAYINSIGTTTLAQKDLFVAGTALAKSRGDYICK